MCPCVCHASVTGAAAVDGFCRSMHEESILHKARGAMQCQFTSMHCWTCTNACAGPNAAAVIPEGQCLALNIFRTSTWNLSRPALNTISAVCIDVYSYCMLSKLANWSPSVRAAYCTWTRGDRFFCLLATPAYNVIHTTELNGDTNVQYNHINRDDDNTKGKTWMLRTCRERKKREGEKKKWRRCLMFNGRSKYHPLFLFSYSKQCSHPQEKLLLKMDIINKLVFSTHLKFWTQSRPTSTKFKNKYMHNTYSIRIHFVSRSTAASHHRLQNSHPALLVRKAGCHEVEGLAWPAGGVGMWLQLQHIWDV